MGPSLERWLRKKLVFRSTVAPASTSEMEVEEQHSSSNHLTSPIRVVRINEEETESHAARRPGCVATSDCRMSSWRLQSPPCRIQLIASCVKRAAPLLFEPSSSSRQRL